MSNPEEADTCVLDTQETYYEGANESFKVTRETQNTSLNESQDFHLSVDSEGDESVVERMKQKQDEEANPWESVEQTDSQQMSKISRGEDTDTIIANDEKDETIVDKKVKENEAIEKTARDVSDKLCESEKKDEHFDEDEVIQGTPPQNYSPSRKVGSVDVMNLKRKAGPVDEPPTKVPKTTSVEDTTNIQKQLEEEESRQSCESDDSYQDLFKNMDKNVVIEETQDPTNLEFSQNSQKTPFEHAAETTNDDKAQEHTKQINQQQNKKCNVKKDDLNLSVKLTDTSTNGSTVINLNSTNENDSQLEDNNLLVEKGDVTSTGVTIADEKSGIGTLDETESIKDTETVSGENNQVEQSNCVESVEKTIDNQEEIPSSQIKSRTSIELIFEGANRTVGDGNNKSKPQIVQIDDDGEKILDLSAEMIYDCQSTKTKPEVVQIDDSHEDGEKIVLDSIEKQIYVQNITPDKSSQESRSNTDFSYKESVKESSLDSKSIMDKKLVNGSTDSKKSDATMSLDSDTFSGCDEPILSTVITAAHDNKADSGKGNSFMSKDIDNIELISISDNETSNVEDKNKSDLIYNSMPAKTVQVEREIGVYLKLKCLLHIDESTKEPVSKELTAVQCEPVMVEPMAGRQKNEDSQSSLADISDNKDLSPGSVNSNPQLYQLPQSRLSIMSSISSSSSASSAASLATRLAMKSGVHFFSVPVGTAKHAKKFSQDVLSSVDKQILDETYDRLTHEWKNYHLLTSMILNYANTELNSTTTATAAATVIDTFANVSNERLDDHHHLEKDNVRSSTPTTSLKMELTVTPKSTKKGRAVKRPRSKLARSNAAQVNGENGADNISNEPALHVPTTETDTPSSRKKIKIENTEDKLLISNVDVLANSSPRIPADELIGKNVFAKWSDNNYYAGTVVDRVKTKYKVNFYDGKSKTLIPEFVIPIPKILRDGLSVYATTKTNDYGSCGMIVDVHTLGNDDTYYTVETDEGERLRVQLQNIFLSADQAQMFKEVVDSTDKSSLLCTPKALGQVTLDNMVDGKRRSKRIGTPLFSTPKSKGNASSTNTSSSKTKSEPSGSGMSAKLKKEKTLSENESMSSDSNVESAQTEDDYDLMGVQKEIIGTPHEQIVKGPQNRIKSKPSNKKKVDDPQTVATLGPIPTNSNIFKGMSFILTYASLETLDRYLDTKMPAASNMETETTETDVETENEADWVDRHFVRDRLQTQILAAGGKIYEDFEKIPKDEYKNTMLITNVPNTTAKSILCLSAGIPVCNHKWIIRCCAENKIVNTAEHVLPNGWSLMKKAYIEAFETGGKKPLSEVVVIIPSLTFLRQFATFWRHVCENAGAVVLIAEDSGAMEPMDFGNKLVVVVSNRKCPSWAINTAMRLQIPVLSTTWVIQCIIEGKLCSQNQHARYRYNYKPN